MKTDFLTLIMKVTNKCNLDCPYCYTRSTIHNGQDMSMDTFKNAIIKGAMATDDLTIVFHGGEPTLRSYKWYKEALDFIEHVIEITGTNIRLQMQTNLTNVEEKKFKLFKSKKIGIGFSYDSITNNLTRKNEEKIINNFNKLKDDTFFKNQLGCICLVTKDNYLKLIDIAEHFEKLKMSYDLHLVFDTVTMIDDKANMDINLVIKEYKQFIDYIFDKEYHMIPYTIKLFIEHILYQKNSLCEHIDCRKKWLGINPNGDVTPCGNEWLQKNNKYLLGNINVNSLNEIFNSINYNNFSNKISEKIEKCKKCEIFNFCHGGCPAKDFSNSGDVGKYDITTCKFNKEMYKYIKEKITNENIKNKNVFKGA